MLYPPTEARPPGRRGAPRARPAPGRCPGTPAQAPVAPGPSPSVRFTGYIQTRETVRGVELSASINRARFAAYGTVADNVTWRIQGEFRTGSGLHRASSR